MLNTSDNLLHQLDALNHWLGDVYGEEASFSTLLIDSGCSQAEIEQIKQKHLSEFLQAVIGLMTEYNDERSSKGRNKLTMQLMIPYYGLIDGKPQDRYAIGSSVGVSGERIRQLVTRRLDVYRDPKQQQKFQDDFAMIGRQLLDNESSNQGNS